MYVEPAPALDQTDLLRGILRRSGLRESQADGDEGFCIGPASHRSTTVEYFVSEPSTTGRREIERRTAFVLACCSLAETGLAIDLLISPRRLVAHVAR